ncbi:hypothetical protein HPP92_017269 [Vanilla planifolia]|uniref:Uncharacterized protein n=1 Tax=Vanilla planifolia TaxID=51239 RepID=A0A835QDR6_VANPL|nr:hypothetical protein HPP92_017269 [Vanilla planifolia]
MEDRRQRQGIWILCKIWKAAMVCERNWVLDLFDGKYITKAEGSLDGLGDDKRREGFLVGSYGLTWALRNSNKVSKIAILNSPLTASSSLPGLFQKLRIPLFGEFTCQNAIMAERFIEADFKVFFCLLKFSIGLLTSSLSKVQATCHKKTGILLLVCST